MPLHLKTNLVEIVFIEVAVGELKKYDTLVIFTTDLLPSLPFTFKGSARSASQ